MDPSDKLFTLAEIAVSIVGFAGIVTVLAARGGRFDPNTYNRLRVLVEAGVGATAFSLLPALATELALDPELMWASCSVAQAFFIVLYIGIVLARQRRAFGSFMPRSTRVADATLSAIGLASVVVLGSNALGVFFERGAAAYLISLSYWFIATLTVFVRIILFSFDVEDPS